MIRRRDEKRIIFARFEKGKFPLLTLFNFGETDGKPVVRAPGFTSAPVWR